MKNIRKAAGLLVAALLLTTTACTTVGPPPPPYRPLPIVEPGPVYPPVIEPIDEDPIYDDDPEIGPW
jgi:hypothetical protein